MNWGAVIGWTGVAQCIAACIGYAFAHDMRRALYYLFAAAITVTVIW
jgi:hypothetical protein